VLDPLRALEVVGERWSLLIIRDAVYTGSTRYIDFQRSLGIATNVLQSRLDGFLDAGIMRRQRYSEQPEMYEYVLTEKGRDFAATLIALTEWGDRWAAPDAPRSSTPTVPVDHRSTMRSSAVAAVRWTPATRCRSGPVRYARRPG